MLRLSSSVHDFPTFLHICSYFARFAWSGSVTFVWEEIKCEEVYYYAFLYKYIIIDFIIYDENNRRDLYHKRGFLISFYCLIITNQCYFLKLFFEFHLNLLTTFKETALLNPVTFLTILIISFIFIILVIHRY